MRADIFLFCEHGLHFGRVKPEHSWEARVQPLFSASFSNLAYNVKEEKGLLESEFQVGGTGITLLDSVVDRKETQGRDPTGLGRWSWVSIRGRQEFRTVFMSAYRPVKNTRDQGSVWRQHERYLLSEHDNRDPITAFDADLRAQLRYFLDNNYQLLIALDCNEDIRNGQIATMMTELGLTEIITAMHGPGSAPATQNRNKQGIPIDGMWATRSLRPIQSGYIGFDNGCPSDHRPLWVEIQCSSILGHRPNKPPRKIAHRLRCDHPTDVRKYIRYVKQHMEKEGFQRVITKLRQQGQQCRADTSASNRRCLEATLNHAMVMNHSIRTAAEKRVRRTPTGEVEWSPTLRKCIQRIDLWSRALKQASGRSTSRTVLRRLSKRLHSPEALRASIRYAERQLDSAYDAYKQVKKQAKTLREEHLRNLATQRAATVGSSTDKQLKVMQAHELQRRLGRASKRLRGSQPKNAIVRVTYTLPDGSTTEATDETTIVHACSASNQARQRKCIRDCPFLHEPLLSNIGLTADGNAVDSILQGTWDIPEGTDSHAADFIRHLRQPDRLHDLPDISVALSTQDHQNAWRRQKVRTGSEPSTLSFAHFVAASQDQLLASYDTLFRNLSLEFGLAPDHICRITDVEILKKPNVYHVDKMRLIQLMPAEYNINNKLIGKTAMLRAEAAKILPPDQYGSRKKHRAIVALLNKRVTGDILRQHRQSGAFCLVDAEGCYDRVAHPVAGLVLRFLGVPRAAVTHAYKVLQKATHCIATGFGVSDPVYGGPLDSDTIPVQGLGQGNGMGPAVWALISSVLIATLYTAGLGVTLVTAALGRVINFAVFAFVDDTDLVITGDKVDTPGEEISVSLQRMVRKWEGGIRATGGALVPSKSCFYLIDFEWRRKTWCYRTQESMPGTIQLRDPATGMLTQIDRLEPHQATKTLGVMLSMDGSETEQTTYLLDLATSFAESVRVNHSSKTEAWYCLTRSFYKTLEYPMLVTTLSKKQWEKILQPVMRAILPRIGLARTFPRTVLFSPQRYQGLQLYHPWYLQESTHVIGLINEVSNMTLSGSLIQGSLEALVIESGDSNVLGEAPFDALQGCTASSWVKTLWETAHTFHIRISTLPPHVNALVRRNDRLLMRAFWIQGYRGVNLRMLNECRMALGVVSLADVATVDGQRLSIMALTGQSGNGLRGYSWPRRPPLTQADWTLWTEALKTTFGSPHGLRHRLRSPLGDWTDPDWIKNWKWILCPETDALFQKENSRWSEYSTRGRVQRTRTRRYCHTDTTLSALPLELQTIPVSVTRSGNTLSVVCRGSVPVPPLQPDLSVHERLMLPEILCDVARLPSDSGNRIAEGIRQRTARAVCDGSFKTGFSTAAALVTPSASTEGTASLLTAVPGTSEEQTSFRAEVGGILMVLFFIEAVTTHWHISDGQVTIALDNESAVRTAKSTVHSLDITAPCFDLWQSIFRLLEKLPVTICFHWVKGHQDSGKERRPLDWWARQNVRVDKEAKQFWTLCQSRGAVSLPRTLRYEHTTVSVQGTKRGSLRLQELYTYMYEPASFEYWQHRGHFDTGHPTTVHWDAIRDLYSGFSIGFQVFGIKFATDFLPTAKTMQRRNLSENDHCPRCNQPGEDCFHLLRCTEPESTMRWNRCLQALRKELRQLDTAPAILRSITTNLARWRARRNPDQSFAAAFQQSQLGWDNFLRGRVHQAWHETQARHYAHIKSRRSSRRWTTALIRQLHLTAWDLWDHRNKVLHGPSGPQAQLEREQREAALRREFSLGLRTILPQHAHLFSLTASDLFALDPASQRQWLQSVALARSYRLDLTPCNDTHSLRREQQFLQRWLTHRP